MGDFFLQIILAIYKTVGLNNLGLTIIEIAVFTRLLFYPLMKQQLHYSKKMNELQPQIAHLKTKHKDNQQAFAQAQMALFKELGINPAVGCLPSLIQIVILFGLLGAMNQILRMGLNTNFLIWNMAKPDAYKFAGLPFAIPGLLVVIAALTQFMQTKMMLPTPPQVRKEDRAVEKKEKESFMEEFAASQSSMVWMFPLIFLVFGTQWPSGLALYWSVSSVLGIIQQFKTTGLGGLVPYVLKLPQRKI